jgi:glycosyltransferase involved in cell wall biosynthesis
MRIALYSPAWPPSSSANGIVTYTENLVPALRTLGHEVYILSHGNGDFIDVNSFVEPRSLLNRAVSKVAPLTSTIGPLGRGLANAVRHLIDLKGIEVLEMEESFGLSRAISGIPVVVRLHGPWFINRNGLRGFENGLRERWEQDGISKATFLSAPSHYVLDAVKHRYNLRGQTRAAVIPNPISPRSLRWRPEVCNKDQLLFVGRFDHVKGGDVVLRAFNKIASLQPRSRLVFVGPDRQIDGKNFHRFARSVLSQDACERTEYRGALMRDEIDRLRAQSFLSIVASRAEVFGYTALEAMALGCPLVASATGGIKEMVKHGERGLLFESGNHDDLADKVMHLLKNPEEAAILGQGARESAPYYHPERVALDTLVIYGEAKLQYQSAYK